LHHLSAEELAARLAAIVDSAEDAIIGTDDAGTIVFWNTAATRLFGYTGEEIVGQSALLLVPPQLHDEDLARSAKLQSGERLERFEAQRIRKGGMRFGVSVSASPVKNAVGRVIGATLVLSELGAQQREHVAQARLAAVVESSDDAIVAKDLNGVVTDWNAAAERMFGYSPEEMIGRSILTIIPPELQHEEPAVLRRIAEGERVEHFETQRLHKSGKRLEVALTMSPIRDLAGRVVGVSKIAHDISDRRRSEGARVMLAAIVESSDDAIISKNLDGIITSWNASAERLFGYKPDEIVGHSVLRLIPRELHYEEPIILRKLRNGERIEHYETRRVKKSGEAIDISLTVSPIKDDSGRVVGASKIVRDISQRKAAEQALIEKEKLAATGRMAATLAHEVNNPLESIMNLSYIIANDGELPRNLQRYADMLVKEVQRAGEITRQTLSYYRSARESGDINLVETISHVLSAKQKKFNEKRITVTTDFQSAARVTGFAGELRQVFENLVENAIDAVHPGGAIRVRVQEVGLSGTKRLVASVCDNGSGIAPTARKKLFEPFFTTKKARGSGVGLWVSRGIVHKHGGSIRVRSSQEPERHGSVFTVVLPVSPGVSSSQAASSSGSSQHSSNSKSSSASSLNVA
jgi:PAS domain S-box-containing protein